MNVFRFSSGTQNSVFCFNLPYVPLFRMRWINQFIPKWQMTWRLHQREWKREKLKKLKKLPQKLLHNWLKFTTQRLLFIISFLPFQWYDSLKLVKYLGFNLIKICITSTNSFLLKIFKSEPVYELWSSFSSVSRSMYLSPTFQLSEP